jgi:hypothetical protein
MKTIFIMKDKFIQGSIAGLIAGTLKDIPNLSFYFLKLTEKTYFDYSGALAFDRPPKGIAEYVFAFCLQLMFSIFLGIIFSHLTPKIKSKHYLLKGAVFGGAIWIFIKLGVLVFQIEILYFKNLSSAIENIANSIFYGIILAWICEFLAKKKTT